jgi:hypothetical protein
MITGAGGRETRNRQVLHASSTRPSTSTRFTMWKGLFHPEPRAVGTMDTTWTFTVIRLPGTPPEHTQPQALRAG